MSLMRKWRRDVPKEFSLAVECCRLPETGAEGIPELLSQVCASKFLEVCRRHRIQGLAWRALTKFKSKLPPEIRSDLREDAKRIAASALLATGISADLNRRFDAEGIPILFLKGLTVSELAYGDPFVKMSNDIDILVPVAEVKRSGEILEGLGYRRAVPQYGELSSWHQRHKESVWTRPAYPPIELHTRLADNPTMIPDLGLASPRQVVEISPGVNLPTLVDEDLLIYLCVHASSSAWFRLKWLADIVALLAKSDQVDLSKLTSRGRSSQAGRAIEATLILANHFFDVPIEKAPIEIQSSANCRLARLGRRELLKYSEPTERPFGTLPIHVAQFLVQPNLKSAALEGVRQSRYFFTE